MERENIPVIDFLDFPAPNTEEFLWMTENDFMMYEICCEYIQLSTSVPARAEIESGFYCRQELENGELCDGTIDVMQIEQPRQIRWKCRECGDMGALINYEDTVWDNSRLPEKEKEIFLENLFADIAGEYVFEDEFYDLNEDLLIGPFDNFEYYVNPYDPDGKQSGGPVSAMIEEMLTCDWMNPDAPVYLNDNMPLAELEESFFFFNARQFLRILQEDETFPLTRTEQLQRKVVRRLLTQTQWPEGYIESVSQYKKNIDETDVWLLHGIRILLDISGLIKRKDDGYQLNNNLLHLLDTENAGQLYRLLFSTYFKEMNLGYLGSSFELPHLQYSVPFILFKLRNLATEWTSVENLLPDILLFSVNKELQFGDMDEMNASHDFLNEDLFLPLERFALIETRITGKIDTHELVPYPDQLRITPLFQKFIEFKV